MSHFTVMVTGEDFNKALEPFIEQHEEGYEQYFSFVVQATASELQSQWEEHEQSDTEHHYDSLDEYAEDYHGYQKNDDGDYGYTRNPNAKWDWYELGGRWSGMLKLKDGAIGLKAGRYHRDAEFNTVNDYADSALVSEIDWEAMRKDEKQKGLDYITERFKAIVDHPMIESWESIRTRHGENYDLARETFHAQSAIKAAKAAKDDFWFSLDDSLRVCPSFKEISKESVFTQEAVSKLIEEYAQDRANTAGHTFAVLHEGKWLERGEMGWWGMVSNEKEHEDWVQSFTNFIDNLPADTRINIVDCHI